MIDVIFVVEQINVASVKNIRNHDPEERKYSESKDQAREISYTGINSLTLVPDYFEDFEVADWAKTA